MKVTVKNLVCGILVSLLGAVCVAGPAAPLLCAASRIDTVYECGFHLFSMNSPFIFRGDEGVFVEQYSLLFGLIGGIGILLLCFGAVLLCLGVAGVFFPRVSKAWNSMGIAALILCFLYLAAGFFYLFLYVNDKRGETFAYTSTQAYIPLAIGFVLYVAYRLCGSLFAEETKIFSSAAASEQAQKKEERPN